MFLSRLFAIHTWCRIHTSKSSPNCLNRNQTTEEEWRILSTSLPSSVPCSRLNLLRSVVLPNSPPRSTCSYQPITRRLNGTPLTIKKKEKRKKTGYETSSTSSQDSINLADYPKKTYLTAGNPIFGQSFSEECVKGEKTIVKYEFSLDCG